MDEKPEPSWSTAIRDAVREFVDAVNDSSKQLAVATEHFAMQSLQATNSARERSEQSAESSSEMARQAQAAAEEARSVTAGLQAAVEEARQQMRQEARQTVDLIAGHATRLNDLGVKMKNDLQIRIDEMAARLEASAAGHQEALETAQAATAAAQAAADRIETSVNAVDIAVASARRAAEEARLAAEQTTQNVGSITSAVTSAQEAAEASRQSASLAEQAGKRSDFASEASMLLERLETDYSLLTRLVQELHTRISSLSSVTTAPPAQTYQPAPLYGATDGDAESPHDSYVDDVSMSPDAETSTDAFAAYAAPESHEALAVNNEAPAPEPEPAPVSQAIEAMAPSGWPEHPPADLEVSSAVPEAMSEQAWQEMPASEAIEPEAVEAEPESLALTSSDTTISGRVQMMLSPVPDFDKLLSLDSALARIPGVHNVTLADYAREEVIFRVELEKPIPVTEFASQLSATAGVTTEVTEASESAVSIRIG